MFDHYITGNYSKKPALIKAIDKPAATLHIGMLSFSPTVFVVVFMLRSFT